MKSFVKIFLQSSYNGKSTVNTKPPRINNTYNTFIQHLVQALSTSFNLTFSPPMNILLNQEGSIISRIPVFLLIFL